MSNRAILLALHAGRLFFISCQSFDTKTGEKRGNKKYWISSKNPGFEGKKMEAWTGVEPV